MKYIASIGSLLVFLALTLTGCHDQFDHFTSDPSARISFSQDTLRLDTLYSEQPSSTRTLLVYNKGNKALKIDEIRLLHGIERGFRINVDGRSGQRFDGVTLPAGDSIHVFVEATLPRMMDDLPQLITDSILFRFNGKQQALRIESWCHNLDQYDVLHVQRDSVITAQRPLYVRDSLVVDEGVTLTLNAGVHLLLGDNAHISVYGTLCSNGTPEERVLIEGLRRDYLIPSVNYRLVPGQWDFVRLARGTKENKLLYTTIRNGRNGLICDGPQPTTRDETLYAEGLIVTNMKGRALSLDRARVRLYNCEFSNSLSTTLLISGGVTELLHCSLANYYAWDKREGSTLVYNLPEGSGAEQTSLKATNTLVDGTRSVIRIAGRDLMGGEIELAEKVRERTTFDHCYLRTALPQSNGVAYFDCIEAKQPADEVYVNAGRDREKDKMDFVYFFQPWADAPWVQKGMPTTLSIDIQGRTRATQPTIGAYEPSTEKRK